jgi:hypothetical protein
MGFIHATPGDIKSFKSSADKIALILTPFPLFALVAHVLFG